MRKLERGLTRYLAAIRAGDAEAIQQALAEANAAGAETRGYAASLDITAVRWLRGRLIPLRG